MTRDLLNEYYDYHLYTCFDFSPGGDEIACVTDRSGQFEVWTQALQSKGRPRQLTHISEWTVDAVCWTVHGVVFSADSQGAEDHQLFLTPHDGGAPRQLTRARGSQHHFTGYSLSRDHAYLLYASNEREDANKDVYSLHLPSMERTLVYRGRGDIGDFSISPDRIRVAVVQPVSIDTDELVLARSAEKKAELIVEPESGRGIRLGPWSPDGSGFYYLTHSDAGYLALARFSLRTMTSTWLARPPADVEQVAVSPDGRILAYSVNEGGTSTLHVVEMPGFAREHTATLAQGVIAGELRHAPRDGLLAMLYTTPVDPGGILAYDYVNRSSRWVVRSPLADSGGRLGLHGPDNVWYSSPDGRRIHALCYRPRKTGPFPAVVWVHGGPNLQERPTYNGLFQYLAARGIAVLAPNYRGSSGFGRDFERLIWRKWGERELEDIQAGREWLAAENDIDGTRIGVAGHSFGGYATLMCLARWPECFSVGVDVCGPVDLVTFTKAVPPTWKQVMRSFLGDPVDDEERLRRQSPMAQVDAIEAPLLVIQAANDPRVPREESDRLVDELRDRGREVKYVLLESGGHGFGEREGRLGVLWEIAEFLEQNLKSRTA